MTGMKQIVFISGKGGTGKTVISGAMAAMGNDQVIADCDVDAANLHMLLDPVVLERKPFTGGKLAVVNPDLCTGCGECLACCRYDAISEECTVDSLRCEGCGLCSHICPVDAVDMVPQQVGEWYRSETRYGPFIHARLGIGAENSGKMVAKIREVAREVARKEARATVLIDGPPGIGCPLISAITGTDLAVVVTEPTCAGLHDSGRILKVTEQLGVPVKVLINKDDLNPGLTRKIEEICRENDIEVIGKLPFSNTVVEAMRQGVPITEYPDGELSSALREIRQRIDQSLDKEVAGFAEG